MKWDRLDKEPNNAFSVFVDYLSSGAGRSIQNTIRSQEKYSRTTIMKWAAQFKWRARAKAYDAETGDSLLEKLIDDRIVMSEKHSELAELLMSKIMTVLNGDESRGIEPFELSSLSDKDIALAVPKWTAAMVELERKSRDTLYYDVMFKEKLAELQTKIEAAIDEGST